jgi:hypothetical protein
VSATGGLSAIPNAIIQINGATISKSVNANDRSSITLISSSVGGEVTATSGGGVSLVDVQGGSIAGNALANTGGELCLSAAITGDVRGSKRSTVSILGGSVQGNLVLSGRTSGVMSGGSVAGTADLDCLTFTMSGGSIAKKTSITQFSQFNLQNGTFGGDLNIINSANGTISGGSVAGNLIADNSSQVEITGGQIGKTLGADGSSKVTMSGGQVLQLAAAGQSTISVSGGSVMDVAGVQDTATIKVSGTALLKDQFNAFGRGNIEFSGGSARSVGIADNATLNMSGSAFILERLLVVDSGKATINGGKINGDLIGRDFSTVTMTAGQAFNARTHESATLSVQGGAIGGSLISDDSSVISLTGGSISGDASAQEGSKLLINGTPFIGGLLEARDTSTVIIAGGGVAGKAQAAESAKLNVSGSAFIAGDLTAFGKSTLTISGGSLGASVEMRGDSTLELSAGTIAGKLSGFENASIAIHGGVVGEIEAQGDVPTAGFSIGGGQILGDATAFKHSGILLVGGTVGGNVIAQGNSRVEIESVAAIAGSVAAFGFGTIDMRGGTVGVGVTPGNLEGHGNSTVNLSGGTVGGALFCLDNSTVTMTGGTVFGTAFKNQCHFNFVGGKILGGVQSFPGRPSAAANELPALTAFDNAIITIFGGGLVATLVDPNFNGMFSKYQLFSGVLPDGTPIVSGFMAIQNATQAQFHLRVGSNWKIDSGGSWGVAANWASNIVSDEPGALAQFLGVLTVPNAPANITLDGNRTLGGLTFDNANAYVIQQGSGGSLTMNNLGATAEISVKSGQHQIVAPVIVQDNTTAFVDHNSSLSLAQGITVAGGKTLTKSGEGILSSAFIRGGSVSVLGGVMNVVANGTNAATSKLDSLTISPDATLDLTNNDMVIQGGASALANVSAMIGSARNGKAKLWTSSGLTSSTAANDLSKRTGLAVILNDNGLGKQLYATFDGQSVDLNSVLVKYTYNGDMDLNGVVDADDYFRIDRGFANHLTGYANGDLDFSGAVDADDYFLIDAAFLQQGTPLAGAVNAMAVPEPSTLALFAVAFCGCVVRRSRSSTKAHECTRRNTSDELAARGVGGP